MILTKNTSFLHQASILSKVVLLVGVLAIGSIVVAWQKNSLIKLFTHTPISVSPAKNFFQEQVNISLSSLVEGSIKYTVDGSEPSHVSLEYTGPLKISESTPLKFAVFKHNKQETPTQLHEIFIGATHTLPIASITTSPENLWDPKKGIYVEGENENFLQTGKEWERSALLQFYETDSTLEFTQTIRLRLHGNAMRLRPQKGFRVYISDEFGREDKLSYPLFGRNGNARYSSFILRTGGDSQTYLRDRLVTTVVADSSSVLTQKSRPVVLYLNGRYWGLYYLYERLDETYFAERYRVKPSTLSMIEIPLNHSETRGQAIADSKNSEADAKRYNELLADANTCNGCQSYAYLNNNIDMENFVEYMFFQLYFSNVDWPYNNAKLWRYHTNEHSPEADVIPQLDGRFRWILFDLDASLGAQHLTLDAMQKSAQDDTYTKLVDHAFPFRNTFNDQQFQEVYQQKAKKFIEGNLREENMVRLIDELAQEIRPEIPRSTRRWYDETTAAGHYMIRDQKEWEENVELLKVYISDRPEAFSRRTSNYFNKELLE